MKLKFLLSFITFCFLTITSSYAQMMGGDSDKHGCKGSAGYTWSQLRKECVRLFDVGKPIPSVDPSNGAAAYLILSKDVMKAEVFVDNNGTKERSMIMKKKKNKFVYKNYTLLTPGPNEFILLKNGIAIYKSKKS